MATKKTAPPRASAAKAKKPGKAPPVSIETAWQDLEAKLRNTLGQNAAGQHPADLEPMHMTFEHAPDLSSLLPEDYQRFVEALGYRWVSTGKKGLSFLPPRWRLQASQGMGDPGRQWTTVREEREAGQHTYRFVMFASEDLNDVNGYCFGRSAHDDALVVWSVEDSLPTLELGPFSPWLTKKLAALSKGASTKPSGKKVPSLGDPLGLMQESLGGAAAKARDQGAAAILGTFPRDTKDIFLMGRKLGVVPELIGEFSELERLTLKHAQLTQVSGALSRLTKLKQLDLAWNPKLETLPPELGQLEGLESLNLDNTGVRALPKVVGQLTRLRYLGLKATPMTTLPPWLSRMSSLKNLDLYQTSLPPEEVEALRQALPECNVGFRT
ncbi:leucine-rich repeat domain-containing protein [Myxococcus sp. NMCA1]|uniref:leucine-rich repeat domain-containing protein n=1 Tax=Myxococcus sp. NMCA1 TaxID=2996785 RepID=UPI0022854838|nr:leucine-rich repeat domain-containing protein [Myxococcus sp. NMCA1]WAM26218.1 leucine-rich repeat domain-containing protein [Myxococcus sp. NMCA1]